MTTTATTATVWVCVDCYLTHHGIREDDGTTPDREPLGLIPEGAEAAAGGACECPEGTDPDCECDRMTFSWTPCEGCGSTLGGAREALTVWES